MVRRTPTGQLVSDSGQPLTADPLAPPAGERPGVTIRRKEGDTMPKADKDGIYRFQTTYIKVRKGDVIPAGAEPLEARSLDAAPENKAKAAAPENRKSGKKSDS